jgi:hypothetical protein
LRTSSIVVLGFKIFIIGDRDQFQALAASFLDGLRRAWRESEKDQGGCFPRP